MELTEAGRLLLRHVETITDRLQAARADLLAYAAGETGTLRVGVYQSVGTRVLPAIIGRFGEAWPGVEVQLTEANSDQGLFELVEPGRARPLVRRAARSRRGRSRRSSSSATRSCWSRPPDGPLAGLAGTPPSSSSASSG